MKTYTVTFELVTPCISAGAGQKSAEIRVPEIRALFRSWLRWAGMGRDVEETLFGKLGESPKAGKIVVRMTSRQPQSIELVPPRNDYFLWTLAHQANNRGFFRPGAEIELEILDRAEQTNSISFRKVLEMALLLGSLGTRSRRGYGSIYPVSVVCDDGWEMTVPRTLQVFKDKLTEFNLKGIRILSLGKVVNDYSNAISQCSIFLHKARCGSNGPAINASQWGSEDNEGIRSQNPSTLSRPALGLPMPIRYKRGGQYSITLSDDEKESRWASPVIFKVIKLNQDHVPLAIFLKRYCMPDGTDLKVNVIGTRRVMNASASRKLFDVLMNPARHKEFDFNGAEVLWG